MRSACIIVCVPIGHPGTSLYIHITMHHTHVHAHTPALRSLNPMANTSMRAWVSIATIATTSIFVTLCACVRVK